MSDDLVKRLRDTAVHSYLGRSIIEEAADRIEALTAERDQWVQHTKSAVWADSAELRLAEADNARLRAVLDLDPWFVGRAAWKKYTDIALKGETQ